MIKQFRSAFQSSTAAPFVFVQISAYPAHEVGLITGIRYAQAQTLTQIDLAAMVVAADIGDPAGAYHPIHPCFKQEVARRAAVSMARLQAGSAGKVGGPAVVSAIFDNYEKSWGAYHHGSGLGGVVCNNANGWLCGGIRVTFDRDIVVKGASAWHAGSRVDNGFELWNDQLGSAALGGTSAGSRQLASALCTNCAQCPCWQPLEFSGQVGPRTVQLNTTFVNGKPKTLKYGWRDYPNMVVYAADADGLPAPPFNVTLTGVPMALA